MTKYRANFPVLVGFSAILLLVGVLGTWSVSTEIEGAIVASGEVTVEHEIQIVQHPEGGVVAKVFAHDGDYVSAGEVLVRLDGTFLKSELATIEGQLAEIYSRRARLIAERDGQSILDFTDTPELSEVDRSVLEDQIKGQQDLFGARRNSLTKEDEQIARQQMQVQRQIEGFFAQHTALKAQQAIIADELLGIRDLFERGLVPNTRLLELERETARLTGEIGLLVARMAASEARISEMEVERLKLKDQRREGAISRLRDISYSLLELQEQRTSLVEQIARLEVVASVSGVVFDTRVFAENSVVRPAEAMMFVVPGDAQLEVSARIDPNDIDQVYSEQPVSLEFGSFNARKMHRVAGRVSRVSADVLTDDLTGEIYYEAIVSPSIDAFADVSEEKLVPGMPVDVFMKTEPRTPLNYLARPLYVYFQRAMRES